MPNAPCNKAAKEGQDHHRDHGDEGQKREIGRDRNAENLRCRNRQSLGAAGEAGPFPHHDDDGCLEYERDHREVMAAKAHAWHAEDQPADTADDGRCSKRSRVGPTPRRYQEGRPIGSECHHGARRQRDAAGKADQNGKAHSGQHGGDRHRHNKFPIRPNKQAGEKNASDGNARREGGDHRPKAAVRHCGPSAPETTRPASTTALQIEGGS